MNKKETNNNQALDIFLVLTGTGLILLPLLVIKMTNITESIDSNFIKLLVISLPVFFGTLLLSWKYGSKTPIAILMRLLLLSAVTALVTYIYLIVNLGVYGL